MANKGNAAKASRLLGWQANRKMADVVRLMADDALDAAQ